MVFLGFGKYARADKIYALEPLRGDERGDGRRTRVWVDGIAEPIVASRTERTILHDMGQDAAAATPLLDEAVALAERLAAAAEEARVDLADLGRRARRLLEATARPSRPAAALLAPAAVARERRASARRSDPAAGAPSGRAAVAARRGWRSTSARCASRATSAGSGSAPASRRSAADHDRRDPVPGLRAHRLDAARRPARRSSALVPLLTVPLYAGAVADAVDRRRLLLLSDVGLLARDRGAARERARSTSPSVPVLFVAEALGTAAYGFQRPARNALTPRLVAAGQLTAAIAVEDVVSNLARVGGPALAGGAHRGARARGRVRASTSRRFAASLVAIWLLPPIAPTGAEPIVPGLRSIVEGLRYVRTKQSLLGIFLVDTNAMIFGMPSALFPAFAEDLGGGAGDGRAASTRRRTRVRSPPRSCRAGSATSAARGSASASPPASGGRDRALRARRRALARARSCSPSRARPTTSAPSCARRSCSPRRPTRMRGRLSGIELAQVAGAPTLGNVEAGVVASLDERPLLDRLGRRSSASSGRSRSRSRCPPSSATTRGRPDARR